MALIDKDQLKAEIKKRLSLIYHLEGDFTEGSRGAYNGLLAFLDTLPESAKRGYKDCNGCEYNRTIKDQIGWQFRGCFGGEYKGKPIAEIELCPLKVDTLPEQPELKPKAIIIRPVVNLQKELMGVSAEVKDAVMLLLKEGWSLKAPDSEREFDQRAVCAGFSSIPPSYKLDVKPRITNKLFEECLANVDPAIRKEVSDNVDKMLGKQPVEYPTSTEMIAEWENNELPLLRDKDFRGDAERMAYNAFMDGFAKGLGYKK